MQVDRRRVGGLDRRTGEGEVICPRDRRAKSARPTSSKNAVTVMKIATGEADEPPDTRNQAALALSKLGASKGGKARAEKLSARRRRKARQKGQ